MCCVGSWCRPSFYTSPRGISVHSAMMDDTQGSKYHSTKRDEHKKEVSAGQTENKNKRDKPSKAPRLMNRPWRIVYRFCLAGRGGRETKSTGDQVRSVVEGKKKKQLNGRH
ncbi:hypothetical protein CEXT_556161 [Caerostris extrusa]|uniref:Uncharacterized protein n=1 Tax=Caerostris extrusa TaxID=172846 RepID=A0AAV4RN72_CAEEX|nr:hypothetical protein CEXT_556161 [Caerostris extrusa]